jgi:hypothetical protein
LDKCKALVSPNKSARLTKKAQKKCNNIILGDGAAAVRKNRKTWIVVTGVAVATTTIIIAVVIVLAINTTTAGRSWYKPDEPIPNIVMIYHGKETDGTLQNYRWQGDSPAPNTNFPYTGTLVNITKGDTIEFAAVNASRQPDYYIVSVWDITNSTSERQQPAHPVLEEYRLDGNRLLIDYNEGGKYDVGLAGIWVRVDLFGQYNDSVLYTYQLRVTK